jgi:cytochrome c oxidase assembly protein subunit 15
MSRLPTISPRAYAAVAVAALVMLTLIVFSGAGVRLTGSGLGCPDWPRCGGTFLPELDTHIAIEYGNRLLSALVGLVSVAAGLLVFRRRPFRRDLVAPALVVLFGVVAQGVLGGITVLLDLRWPIVMAHYLLSMVLLTAATVLVWRVAGRGSRPATDRPVALATRALVVAGGVVIFLGTLATAAGPHAGGAGTGDVVERLDVWGASTLKNLIYAHGHMAAVIGALFVGLWLFARARRADPHLREALTVACLLMAAQGVIGLIQYYNALPAEVVWIHASLPAVMWSVFVWGWLEAEPQPAQVTSRSRPVSTS